MPLLSTKQLDDRIALYSLYREAVARLDGLGACLPEECPYDLRFTWGLRDGANEADEIEFAPRRRTLSVIRRAWPALRKAVLAAAEKELADAEQAVLKFEAGDEVAESSNSG